MVYSTGGKHKACGPNPALHLVLSSLAPCSHLVAVPSFLLLVKEELHLYRPEITFGPLKATTRLMWPPVKMSLMPLHEMVNYRKERLDGKGFLEDMALEDTESPV